MTLTRTKPQQVTSDEGWQVESAGREAVLYREEEREALVGVDRGVSSTRVYLDDLAWVGAQGQRTAVEPVDKARALQRLVQGLEFMGVEVELCSGEGQPLIDVLSPPGQGRLEGR